MRRPGKRPDSARTRTAPEGSEPTPTPGIWPAPGLSIPLRFCSHRAFRLLCFRSSVMDPTDPWRWKETRALRKRPRTTVESTLLFCPTKAPIERTDSPTTACRIPASRTKSIQDPSRSSGPVPVQGFTQIRAQNTSGAGVWCMASSRWAASGAAPVLANLTIRPPAYRKTSGT